MAPGLICRDAHATPLLSRVLALRFWSAKLFSSFSGSAFTATLGNTAVCTVVFCLSSVRAFSSAAAHAGTAFLDGDADLPGTIGRSGVIVWQTVGLVELAMVIGSRGYPVARGAGACQAPSPEPRPLVPTAAEETDSSLVLLPACPAPR